MKNKTEFEKVKQWAEKVAAGKIIANEMRVLACKRFLMDLKNPIWEFKAEKGNFIVSFIEATFIHIKGPARGKPFLLEMWQKFCCYNLAGFYIKGTNERRFKEALIYLPRKNAKTFFASALAWSFAFLDKREYSIVNIVATKMDRALEAFNNIRENIANLGEDDYFKILDNNAEHSISRTFEDGKLRIQALASDSKRADGINGNIFVLDEIHAYKSENDYYVYKQAMKAYINKLLIGITSAGSNINSFCYRRVEYCKKVLKGVIQDNEYFIFICEADNQEDYTNPLEHEKANPNYNVTIRAQDILNESLQAQNDPSGRNEFLNKSLNIYTTSTKAYFDVYKVQKSDEKYNWTLDELSKLPIVWYGGADLSKVHDLSGAVIHGKYKNVDISISHAFIPVATAFDKAEKDNIPFFLWKERGWLTLCNSEIIEYEDVVQWFIEMRKLGFRIKLVGYDQRYSHEFVLKMKKAGFKMRNQWQRYVEKTEGFRAIENSIIKENFYYLHNKAYEYCISNVKAIEDSDDFVRFEKIMPTQRIDLFDADVIAVKQMLIDGNKSKKIDEWFGDD
ncbi:MAG: terminase large subunit [Eubacterium sp.]